MTHHPFTDEDIGAGLVALAKHDSNHGWDGDYWMVSTEKILKAAWDSAVARRSVIIDNHFFKSDEDSGWYDAYIIKLSEDKP